MRYLLTAAAFLGTLCIVCMAAVFAVLAFAGPHSDTLSKPMQVVVYVLAYGAVLGLPVLAARATWRARSKSAADRP
jgi:hypothetical protein